MYDKIVALTKKLVSIPSMNGTPGEKNIGEFLAEYLSKIPYFQEHPNQLYKVPLKNDSLGRVNVYALLIGEKDDNPDTIIIHGHTDTVMVDDYGALKEHAFDCDRLMEELKKIEDTLAEDVRNDLNSGDYLFGRGASDMKGGDAVHIVVFEELAKNVKKLSGNILLSLNPVEESLHKGFIDGIETMVKIKEEYNLNYLFGINNDFICGMYPGDETRYVYTGSVGKVLPCFYIRGKETHVGQAFEGFDCCQVAAEIVKEMNLNSKYCDGYDGEYPAPPIALQMRDLKPYYSVQTPFSSFVYINYMVHNKSITDILAEIKEVAAKSLDIVEKTMNDKYREYCELISAPYNEIQYNTQVLEYQDVYEMAKANYEGDLEKLIDRIAAQSVADQDDMRETSLKVVEKLSDLAGIKIPTVIVFFATPFCPHNTLKSESEQDRKLIEEFRKILDDYSEESGEIFEIMHFFPSLTDSSFLKIDDDMDSIIALQKNFPKQDLLYPIPYEDVMKLNIPGINYGTFGKDAHKWTERVKMSYSFGKLPQLILKTVSYFLGYDN